MHPIEHLLKPASVAVIGASADPSKTSGRPVAYLRKHGYAGRLYPVNPRVADIDGLACYPDIASLPEAPDVGIVLLGAERAHEAVRSLAAIGTKAAIVLAAGYTEAGEGGAARQQALLEAAGSMRLLGPNTIGLVNLTDAIPLSASAALEMDRFPAGNIGVVSQSGGILGALLSRAAARGIGLSKLISTSNEADLDLSDFVDYFAGDPATDVIALYVEAIRNVNTFRAAALKARAAGKTIVAYKIGRSESGARAAVSHTGAMAGADRMYDALFRQSGVIRADTFADLLDIPAALATRRTLAGKRVAILTSTGGAGTLIADSLGVCGFEAPAPDAATAAALRALQQGSEAVLDRNPIDVTLAGLKPDLLRGAVRALLASPTYDALVVIVGSSGVAQPDLMAGALRDSLAGSTKPVFAYVSPHAPEAAGILNRGGIPTFYAPESVSAAFAAMHACPAWRAPAFVAPAAVTLPDLPSGSLDEAQAKALFARFGITPVREVIVTNAAEARAAAPALGDRVVLKMLSSTITHKSDVGGVAVGVPVAVVGERLESMAREVASHTGHAPGAYLLQEMATGTEMILGFHRDPLGDAILLGMGGVTAELVQDTTLFLPLPGSALGREEAHTMIAALKTAPLLTGYRGRARCDVEALVDAIVAFSAMVATLGEKLVEAEINPLFVLAEGQGVRAADGVAVLSR
jgi:acyl-CoA synthetase (NDP forming)